MRLIIYLFLFTVIFGVSVFAQKAKPKTSELPAGISEWAGEDTDKILENEIIKARLKKLLGEKNYASFTEYFETSKPIEKKGDFLFAAGCLIRACTRLESAVAIDFANNTIHAAIYNEIEETKYFNESGTNTPQPIIEWANRLENLKKTDSEKIEPEAILIAEFTHNNKEVLLQQLDNYVNRWQDDPAARGLIFINGSKNARSKAEKQIKDHIKNRGINLNRLVFQNGNGNSKAVIELWLVPDGAEPPPAPKKSGETAVQKKPEKV